MLKQSLLAASLAVAALLSTDALAQKRNQDFPRTSPNAAITQTVGVSEITVTYGRPSVKGRVVFGELEKFGNAWRIGANEATTITFPHDVKIEGKPVSAGTYALLAIPKTEKDWTIVVNSVANMWGAYVHDPAKDVIRVDVKAETVPHTEFLTFDFTNVTPRSAVASFTWAKTRVPFKIEVNSEEIVRKLVAEKTANTTDGKEYQQFARMAFSSDFLVEDAIEWAKKAVGFEASYDRLAITARLLAKAGKYKEAVQFAERAMAADQSKKTEPGVWPALDTMMPDWKKK